MNQPDLSSADALGRYRQHIQNVVGDILEATDRVPPGIERLCAGLEAYWEAGYARRDERRLIVQSTTGGEVRNQIDAAGKPFAYLLVSELKAAGRDDAAAAAGAIYQEALAITLEELGSGERALQHRESLLAAIRGGGKIEP